LLVGNNMSSNNHSKISHVLESEIETKYKFGRTLGHGIDFEGMYHLKFKLTPLTTIGTFATVRLATRLTDNNEFAVKIVKRSSLSRDDENALKMEIQILQSTSHPNIIGINEVDIDF
jgi:serine/threonine protein kinase